MAQWSEFTCNAEDVGWGDTLEKEMAIHSSILTWEIPQTGESGELRSIGSQRVRHNLALLVSCDRTTT